MVIYVKQLRALLIGLSIFAIFTGCATQAPLRIQELSLPADVSRVRFYEEQPFAPNNGDVFSGERLFFMARFEHNGKGQRVRLAIRRYADGELVVQVLPTTSLMVLETLHISDGVISSEANGGESSDSDFKRLFYGLLGDALSSEELFALLLGRIPRTERFQSTWTQGEWVTDSFSTTIGVRGRLVDILISEKTELPSEILLRDIFRENPMLQIQYSGEMAVQGRRYPEIITARSFKRNFQIELRLIKVG